MADSSNEIEALSLISEGPELCEIRSTLQEAEQPSSVSDRKDAVVADGLQHVGWVRKERGDLQGGIAGL